MNFLFALALSLSFACSGPPAPAPIPTSPPVLTDMADYCHPCCLPGTPNCGLACEDCIEAACGSDPRAPAMQGCCSATRVPPDGGQLCPR